MAAATDRSSKAAGRVLLPSHFVPTRYELDLTPDLEAFTFKGIANIDFTVDHKSDNKGDCREISLHAKELCFASASYTDKAGLGHHAEEMHVNSKTTIVKFIFATPVTDDVITLEIQYSGFLNNQMAGFYRSSYTDIEGKSQIMASTQFEALDARRCFPCVDEPAAKATFVVALTIPRNRQCFSNMPSSSVVTVSSQHKKVCFLESPRMSTYLLAFCVGEFDSVQAVSEHGVVVQVYTPPGKSAHGQFALDTAVKSLDAYDEFFQHHYPLPKLDMVAIPEFAAGAMENWGLVTYREVDLLIDPVKASSQQKQRVATVVTHELAHQWFGNLVTMKWWDDLWLNEGFASWAENWAADRLYPEYAMWDQFTTGHLNSALRLDALKSSHPIQVPIHHAEEVDQVFDAISYCKGGSVVRMIKAVLGMKHFQEGLAAYMKKFEYGNTETFDLWNSWEEVSGVPVGEMMASWTEQMGFPLVRVLKEDWQDDKVVLELDQTWFLSDGCALDAAGAAKKWTIPVLTCNEGGAQADMTLMREKTATVTIPVSKGGWVKLNAGQEVPMRVLPSEEMLKRMAVAIQTKAMGPIDRAGLLNDSYALVKAGHMSPESLILLMDNYKDEDAYIVWQGLSSVLHGLDSIVSDDEAMSASFKPFAKAIVLKLMNKVGWEAQETDEHLTTLLRGMMINLLSDFAADDYAVAKEALKRFNAFLEDADDVTSLPTDMRTPVFKIVLQNGGAKEYEAVKSYFYTATDSSERKHVLSSMGHTSDVKLKLSTMEWTTSGEVKLQDFFYAMGSVGHSSVDGREISWTFFQENFAKIKLMLGKSAASLMDACVVMCAGNFSTKEKADEITAFFEANPLPNNHRKISQLTENMHANANFLAVLKASELSKAEFWDAL